MQPGCPECRSHDIDPPVGARPEWGCRACGALFALKDTLVTCAEAEAAGRDAEAGPAFTFHRDRAEVELRDPDGMIAPLRNGDDAEEMWRLLDDATLSDLIELRDPRTALGVRRFVGPEEPPVLVVYLGGGPLLVGPGVALEPSAGEDPVASTLRWIEGTVADANAVADAEADRTSGGAARVRGGPTSAAPGSRPRPGSSSRRSCAPRSRSRT